jgi:hypothetical protein
MLLGKQQLLLHSFLNTNRAGATTYAALSLTAL